MAKKYTAEEMREIADEIANVNDEYHSKASAMLLQAADILEGIRDEIDIIENMPKANLDGSFENQRVNGERLMAKISFYDKVKEIVVEVSNV